MIIIMFSNIVSAQNSKPGLGRVPSIGVAPIREVDEATGLVRVSLPATGGKSLSPWLWRLTGANGLTLPRYNVGDTLVYGMHDDSPNTGFQLGIVQNAVNPPSETDRYTLLIGDSSMVITESLITLSVKGTVITIEDGKIDIKGVESFKVNGKEVSTVGATDSDGDSIVTKGWD